MEVSGTDEAKAGMMKGRMYYILNVVSTMLRIMIFVWVQG